MHRRRNVNNMKRLNNALPTINKLMSENEKILFNLFYLISDSEDTSEDVLTDIEGVIEERLDLNPKLNVIANEAIIRPILNRISERKKVSYNSKIPMVIYRCDKVTNAKKASGHMILSNAKHKEILEKFIIGMVWDLEKRPMYEVQYIQILCNVGKDTPECWSPK